MAYNLSVINRNAREDPEAFARECESEYHSRLEMAVGMIRKNISRSPIVLLSGPSGSGKTTTAKRISDELGRSGIMAHTVSLDNYFRSVSPDSTPRTPTGEYDFESPLCLDMELINAHFAALARGEEILIPHFRFSTQSRSKSKFTAMRLMGSEIAIFEGIHALNDIITRVHPDAFRLYISARSDVADDSGRTRFKGTWIRLIRRVVRDSFFRGTSAQGTLRMWANVRRGEKLHISPFKNSAHCLLDTSMQYEISALKRYASEAFGDIPGGAGRFDELRLILPALELFEDISPELIPPDSILREFIGGGKYTY
ncbi:MAG: nucleoside kinase [Oscillospiraceae bacterium]|nr:nucleoside kinase [Oscillospiraceae bacterium]